MELEGADGFLDEEGEVFFRIEVLVLLAVSEVVLYLPLSHLSLHFLEVKEEGDLEQVGEL